MKQPLTPLQRWLIDVALLLAACLIAWEILYVVLLLTVYPS